MPKPQESPATPAPSPAKFNPYPFWSPRFWHGMRWGDWMKLWAGHGFRTHPLRFGMACLLTGFTPFNSVLARLQAWRYGRQIADFELSQPPLFIIGHWRSGTTLLHELMYLDERFTAPNTYQCFTPHHCLVSEWILPKLLKFILPRQRPMDNMVAGWDRPQEDEFALLTLGAPTPYLRMAFPNDPPVHMNLLDMADVEPAALRQFEQAMLYLVKLIAFQSPDKQVLLKSPPHTGRVGFLSRLFPGAKFVHIARNPYSLFSSTLRLWDALDEAQGFYPPKDHNGSRAEYVFACLERMYHGLEQQRSQLSAAQLCDLKYEDLVKNPEGELARVYEELGLDSFATLQPKITQYFAGQKDYRTNVHQLDPELKARIRQRWATYFDRYGYE